MGVAKFKEVRAFLENFQEKNKAILLREMKKQGIGQSEDLYRKLSVAMEEKTVGLFHLELVMLRRGRFVDMGVGRGVPIEKVKAPRQRSRGAKRKRRAKKFYSKPFYGRLNDLQGAVGYKMMEEAQQIVRQAIKTV